MRIEESVIVDASVESIWQRVSDPLNWPRELGPMHVAHVPDSPETGVGARYQMHIGVGAGEIGSLIEIWGYNPPSELHWTTVRGLEQSGYWLLRQTEDGRCRVTLRLFYQAAGGIAALIADEVSAWVVRRYVGEALRMLRLRCEGTWRNDRSLGGLLARGLDLAADAARTAGTLAGARLLRPARPDRYLAAAQALRHFGPTAAGACAAAAAIHPAEPALIDEAGELTFAQVHERTNRLASALQADNIHAGHGVALLCRNHRGFVESLVALSKLGADALLLNTGLAGPQLAEILEREAPRAIIFDSEFEQLLPQSVRRRRAYLAWCDRQHNRRRTLERLIENGDPQNPAPPSLPSRTTILTSGTSRAPRSVSRSSPGLRSAASILSAIPLRARERMLVAAPLFHQWGLAQLGLGLFLSNTVVLRRKFDPEETLATIEREQISCCPMVPIMCQRILELPDQIRRRYDTSSLRSVPLSGSAVSGQLALSFMDEFGELIYNLYGSTEVGWVAIAGPRDLRRAPGTAGRPPRGTDVRVLDENGASVRPGSTGRIFVSNELLFGGYTEGGSKEMIDGLMATGDLGHFDDHGRLFVDGRDDDMIVSGGENIFPQEVEEALGDHEAVRDAAVVGVDDEQFGQRLKAYIVSVGSNVDAKDLQDHVKQNLAGFKSPREIEFVDELPRNEQGKVLKQELRQP